VGSTERWDAVVVGGGIAGAAAGCGLASRGRRVLVLEREPVAGVHATGRNAAILRHGFGPASDLALARETRRVVLEGGLGEIGLRECGSLHLGERTILEAQSELLNEAGVRARVVERDEVVARVPVLAGTPFPAALRTDGDGVLDVHAIHQAMLAAVRQAGGAVRPHDAVVEILTDDAGVSGVRTGDRLHPTRLAVDAAGPWAEEVAATAGARPVGLRPCRRHLLQTEPQPDISPDWPVIWDVSAGIYFRPESGGLLICPCDEDEMPPVDCRDDPAVVAWGVEKIVGHVPAFADLRILRSWAGLRTLTPDGACVVGFDPAVEGLFWVAGLGGHGVSAAGGLARLVGELVVDGGTELVREEDVSPARLG
jgi:D-arginine dehydrogenase